jgi:hypothetical protein
MGFWKTVNNPSGFKVNIEQKLINAMKKEGSKFCWFKDNLGINQRNNIDYYENVSNDDNNEEDSKDDNNEEDSKDDNNKEDSKDDNNEEDSKDDNNKEDSNDDNNKEDSRQLKKNISVIDSDGNTVVGYITHIVRRPCSGTPLCKWFIIQPGTYPTRYNISDVVITDL